MMKATHSQLSKIARKRKPLERVMRIGKNSLLLMLARRGRFNCEDLKKFSGRIGKQFNLKVDVVMCDDTGGADMEFLGIEVI